MTSSELQRIAEALLAGLDRDLQADRRELDHWINRAARWRDLLATTAPDNPHARAAAESMGTARQELRTAAQHLQRAHLIGKAWAEKAVTSTQADQPVSGAITYDMTHGLRGRPAGPATQPDGNQAADDDVDPLNDDLQAAIDELTPEEEARWQKVYAHFPKGGTHAQKAKFFRWAAEQPLVPDYMRPMLLGNAFNHEVYPKYPVHEVTINKRKRGTTVRRFRVDAMDWPNEIVSLKYTQLAEAGFDAAKRYIDELGRKYNPDRADLVIAPSKGNTQQLARSALGRRLRGKMILGVPLQSEPVPDAIVAYARDKWGIAIREIETDHDAQDTGGAQ